MDKVEKKRIELPLGYTETGMPKDAINIWTPVIATIHEEGKGLGSLESLPWLGSYFDEHWHGGAIESFRFAKEHNPDGVKNLDLLVNIFNSRLNEYKQHPKESTDEIRRICYEATKIIMGEKKIPKHMKNWGKCEPDPFKKENE